MGVAEGRIVGAVHVGPAAKQGEAGGHPGLQPLKLCELRLGAPEFHGRAAGIDLRAGVEPGNSVAGPERAYKPVPGMGVAVDQPRYGRHAAPVDHLRHVLMRGAHLGVGADRDNPVGADRDGGIVEHPALGVQRDGGDVADQDVGHAGLATWR